jgi:hypothetical protein
MPEGTLKAFADHGEIGPMLPADGGDCEMVLAQFAKAASTLTPWPPGSRMKERSPS